MTPTELTLVRTCREIGGISDCSSLFTGGIADLLDADGRALEDMTVKELLVMFRRCREEFNQVLRT